jgi:alpha-beta hydrolase superfamily lysophospholipase
MIQILFVQAMLFLLLENVTDGAQWKPDDMNPGKLKPTVEKFVTAGCDGTPCGYNIYYFTSGPRRPGQKTILYIAGGPGQIVDRDQRVRELKELEATFRFVYFDIRGAGLSAPHSAVDNSTDNFLRAKYIVKDIEEIRKEVLRDDPWDAVYGHSAGTVFGQIYAEQFGKITPSNSKVRVKTLILSAPISRHKDNEPFREAMIVTNLRNILENNADPKCLFASTNVREIRNKVANILASRLAEGGGRSKTFLTASNDFCFLGPARISSIIAVLEKKLELIKQFGGVSFVFENHDELTKDNEAFRAAFPYPDLFFSAMRTLDRLGSPIKKNSDLFLPTKSFQVDAALVLGYYLDSPKPKDAASPKCNPNAELFKTLNSDSQADLAKTIYCERFDSVVKLQEQSAESAREQRSERTANVLGINQGIHRWLVKLLPAPPEGCNNGSEFQKFANDSVSDNKKTARKLAKRVGFENNESVCAWDPEKYKHNVPTLILKGSLDAAVNGCQAEHFFKAGLANSNKQFIEFPEFGHDWFSEIKPERKKDLAILLAKFIGNPGRFAADASVKDAKKRLGVRSRTAASFAASGC